ncbi:unnamed protein product, partial [Prorocentrum cordatum]
MHSQFPALLARAPRNFPAGATGVAMTFCAPMKKAKAQPERAALDRGELKRTPSSLRFELNGHAIYDFDTRKEANHFAVDWREEDAKEFDARGQLAATRMASKEGNKGALRSGHSREIEGSATVLGSFVDECYCNIAAAKQAHTVDAKSCPLSRGSLPTRRAELICKRKRYNDTASLPHDRRSRANVGTLVATHALTYSQARSLLGDAHAGGPRGVGRLIGRRGAGAEDVSKRANVGSNASRRLRRRFLRGSLRPGAYFAEVCCWSKRRSCEQQEWVAVGLPREYFAQLAQCGALGNLGDISDLEYSSEESCAALPLVLSAMQVGSMIPAGLRASGVPCQRGRDQSVEIARLSLPGLPIAMEARKLRAPITGPMKASMSTNTRHDMFSVIPGRFLPMATGNYPAARHDGRARLKSDFRRGRRAGADLGHRSALAQTRADWERRKQVTGFPQFSEKAGRCLRLSLQCAALRGVRPRVYDMETKFHTLFEMDLEVLQGHQPETRWTYKDEDFGGAGARSAERFGSVLTPEDVAEPRNEDAPAAEKLVVERPAIAAEARAAQGGGRGGQ